VSTVDGEFNINTLYIYSSTDLANIQIMDDTLILIGSWRKFETVLNNLLRFVRSNVTY